MYKNNIFDMAKKKFFKKLKNFEKNHKMISFIFVMILTIILIRLSVMIYNPNITLLDFEFHHFDYGISILLITSLFLLFGEKRYSLYRVIHAIAFGVILDDLWFIRSNIIEKSGLEELLLYDSTFPSVIIFVLVILVILFLINYFKKK